MTPPFPSTMAFIHSYLMEEELVSLTDRLESSVDAALELTLILRSHQERVTHYYGAGAEVLGAVITVYQGVHGLQKELSLAGGEWKCLAELCLPAITHLVDLDNSIIAQRFEDNEELDAFQTALATIFEELDQIIT